MSNRRIYEGAYNNRVDRIPQAGNSFKVEGVPNHVLQGDCYISESVDLIRTRHADVGGFAAGGGGPLTRRISKPLSTVAFGDIPNTP